MAIILRVLVGAALLTLGRKLFWLFVAGIGFVAAITLATRLLHNQPEWLIIVLALFAGLIGALLAVFLERLAIGIAGFLAGGYFALSLVEALGFQVGPVSWLPFVIGGILGAILVITLFDWALILLSSLTGASLIAQSLPLAPPIRILLFAIVLIVGIVIQASLMAGEQHPA